MHRPLARIVLYAVAAVGLSTALTGNASAQRDLTVGQPSGTLLGRLELCGGPAPQNNGCHVVTGRWSGCSDHVCRTLNVVDVETPSRRTVAHIKIRRGRFSARLRPAEYRIELLWTSQRATPKVAHTWHVTVRARRPTKITFRAPAG